MSRGTTSDHATAVQPCALIDGLARVHFAMIPPTMLTCRAAHLPAFQPSIGSARSQGACIYIYARPADKQTHSVPSSTEALRTATARRTGKTRPVLSASLSSSERETEPSSPARPVAAAAFAHRDAERVKRREGLGRRIHSSATSGGPPLPPERRLLLAARGDSISIATALLPSYVVLLLGFLPFFFLSLFFSVCIVQQCSRPPSVQPAGVVDGRRQRRSFCAYNCQGGGAKCTLHGPRSRSAAAPLSWHGPTVA